MNNKKTLSMVMTGLFMAIIAVMTFIPNVGYINLIVIKATLLHVPVIVGLCLDRKRERYWALLLALPA